MKSLLGQAFLGALIFFSSLVVHAPNAEAKKLGTYVCNYGVSNGSLTQESWNCCINEYGSGGAPTVASCQCAAVILKGSGTPYPSLPPICRNPFDGPFRADQPYSTPIKR